MTNVLIYDPANWYWTIGSDVDNVWSSARAALVPSTDADYQAWTSAGFNTPNMASMADLEDTLRVAYPPGTPKTYAALARYNAASGGVVITSVSAAAFLTDPVSRNAINSADDYLKANASETVDWKMADGSFVSIDAATMTSIANTVAGFVQLCFTCESQLVAGIDDGSVTTLAQIDDAFAAISNVFP